MKTIKFLPFILLIALLGACKTPEVAYLTDMEGVTDQQVAVVKDIRVRPEDKISIIVNSKDPVLTNLFNLPYITQQLGQVEGQVYATPRGVSGYTVDKNGYIDFPVLGKVHIQGMNREEIANHIKQELISKNLVKDPVVTVEFLNLTISVLGEVNHPGRFVIDKDKLTLLDALSMAGDLTIHGKRENVMVQREENGTVNLYKVDLSSGRNLYASPVYYLQQNDIVYVEPNKYKAKDSSVNNKALRWSSIWISIVSLLTSITIGAAGLLK